MMMEELLKRAEALAAAEQRRQVRRIASRISEVTGGSVETGEDAVAVSARGLLKRRMNDATLRFLLSFLE